MTTSKVAQLLAGIEYQAGSDVGTVAVSSITSDSREVTPGALFVAIVGASADGHDYVKQAVAQGAAAVVVNQESRDHDLEVPVIRVADTGQALGVIAAAFYKKPAERMTVIGITGTNGKTTCAYLIEEMVVAAGGNPGVIGTVNFRFAGICRQASHTTPDPVQLQSLLAEMVNAGVSHVIMEVSSHALEQGRVEGISFDVTLFTNLSRDHLDFHGDMEGYFASKKILFIRHLKRNGHAVIVSEGNQSWGERLVEDLKEERGEQIMTCGKGQMIDSRNEQLSLDGIAMQVNMTGKAVEFVSPLIGGFNIRNILGVLGVGKALAVPIPVMRKAIARCCGAPGRMEKVFLPEVAHPKIIVDYAHTPDALQNVLETIKPLAKGRLLVVFGCGGDRDRGKRPMMGAIAVQYADVAIATSDNPRTEDPGQILAEIEAGMKDSGGRKVEVDFLRGQGKEYLVIESRHQAIACAINLAKRDDVVLISGKGHEDYQLTRSGKVHFDDRQEAKQELEKVWGKAVGTA
ncbi:MAG: UDP-N-acetylmuramoyl-L-alanyl-D-glutamate--2,6-diaminopimelate ligase [Thermodesulfobacteriota bacterium]